MLHTLSVPRLYQFIYACFLLLADVASKLLASWQKIDYKLEALCSMHIDAKVALKFLARSNLKATSYGRNLKLSADNNVNVITSKAEVQKSLWLKILVVLKACNKVMMSQMIWCEEQSSAAMI